MSASTGRGVLQPISWAVKWGTQISDDDFIEASQIAQEYFGINAPSAIPAGMPDQENIGAFLTDTSIVGSTDLTSWEASMKRIS